LFSAVTGVRKAVYLALAAVFFGLAVVGAILPGVPTTPFLLLTSFFLVRSSPALNDRLLQSRTFGPILRDWHRHRGIRPRVKAVSIALMIIAVGLSLYWGSLPLAAKVVVFVAAATGLIVVLRLPVIRED
jgi:hypothetical protein